MAEKADSPTPAAHSPGWRNLVHAGVFVALAWPVSLLVDPRGHVNHGTIYVVGIMLVLTLFNLFVARRLTVSRRLMRAEGVADSGFWMYPLALALCFLIFPPFAAMGAWAALAGGDAAAGFFGRLMPRPRLPWNAAKSWAGLLAFVIVAFLFAYVAIYACPSQQFLKRPDWSPELPFVWTLAMLAALTGAFLESLDLPALDDNLRVPLGTAAVLWASGSFLSFATRNLPATTHVQPRQFVIGIFINLAAALAVWALRVGSVSAALLGACLGTFIYFFAQWQGYLLLILFVALGGACTRVGWETKRRLGTAEAGGGTRRPGNVLANLLVPALCCLAYPLWNGHPAALLAFAGALAAAAADTVSSELGVLTAGQPVLITTFARVPPGTNGGVTIFGTCAGALAALLVAGAACASGFIAEIVLGTPHVPHAILIWAGATIFAAGLAGTTVDSVLGATVEDRWPGVHKGAVNFVCTLVGAATAGGLSLLWLS